MIIPPPLPSPTPHGNVLHALIPQNKEIVNNKKGNNNEKVGNNSNSDNAMDVDGDGSNNHPSQAIVRATA